MGKEIRFMTLRFPGAERLASEMYTKYNILKEEVAKTKTGDITILIKYEFDPAEDEEMSAELMVDNGFADDTDEGEDSF